MEINKDITNGLQIKGCFLGEQCKLVSTLNSPFLFVAPNAESLQKTLLMLKSLDKKCLVLDSFDTPFLFSKFQTDENKQKLLNALFNITNNSFDALISLPEIFAVNLPNPTDFKNACINFVVGNSYKFDDIISKLTSIGYSRVDNVNKKGEFAVRGDLLDIFAINFDNPIRLDFFDDEIEKIISFDNVNLLTISTFENVVICPNKLCLSYDDISAKLNTLAVDTQNNIFYDFISNIELGKDLPLELFSLFDAKTFNILDYFDDKIKICSSFLTSKTVFGDVLDKISKNIINTLKIENLIEKIENKYKKLNFNDFFNKNAIIFENSNKIIENCLEIKCKNFSNYLYNLDLIKSELILNKTVKDKKIIFCLDNDYTFNSLKDILYQKNIPFSLDKNNNGIILTKEKYPYNICFEDEDTFYIGSTNFAHKKEVQNKDNRKIKYLPKKGELVVHNIHGIGKCDGVVTLKVMGAEKDFFKILYRNDDVLYVPTENTDSIALYLGDNAVNLNKLGGKEFATIKRATNEAIEEMAKDLLLLYAKRKNSKGFKYSEDNYLMTQFEDTFPYQETADQLLAIKDIKQDMTSGKVMDRLICGDVGYGKTEVAMRAGFKACIDNKQVAVLAPTTILSLQHYLSFKNRFAPFGIRVEMLNRFKTAKEKAEIIEKLKQGEIDVVCGTHSLLADGVDFKDLGLLILDEEQRFGVKAKEKLKGLKNNVDVLTMSATPIPRTLNMAMLTLRDISIINTPPQDRLPVSTYVMEFDLDIVAQAVKNELDRDGQVLIVYNDIERIYNFAHDLKEKLDDNKAVFDVAHGKLNKTVLEDAIKRLYDKKTNVFISTTLIENGVDLPSANTLIVLDSQNLGLSQMYQLRGRVGRSIEQAYAYFTYPKESVLTVEAMNRLETLAENTELGSGFKIAMRDLQLRGAGELLGKSQHGHMVKVGYDMYVKMLEEATRRLKGEKVEEERDVKLDIAINAKIPNNFIQDETEKLQVYSKISNIKDISSQREILGQLLSTYGEIPKEIKQLTNLSLLKAMAEKLGVKHIVINKTDIFVEFYKENFDFDKVYKQIRILNKFSIKKAEMPTIILNPKEFSPLTAQSYILDLFNRLI